MVSQGVNYVHFKLNEVKLATKRFKSLDIESAVKNMVVDDDEYETQTKPQFKYHFGKNNYPLSKIDRPKNGFVAAVYEAYCQHYPLELSVDDFWVAITQGVSMHINKDGEKYRHLFVNHQGQKELVIDLNKYNCTSLSDLTNEKWQKAIHGMTELINQDVKNDIVDILTTPFSSTKEVEQMVFDCTLMDSLKTYYKYKFCLQCGIPNVTLHGTVSDYQSLISRVERLKEMLPDLDWWFVNLIPHLNQLLRTAEGNPDLDWWSKICH